MTRATRYHRGRRRNRDSDDPTLAGSGQGSRRAALAADEAIVAPGPQALPGDGGRRRDEGQKPLDSGTRGADPEQSKAIGKRHRDGLGRQALPVDAGGHEDEVGEDPRCLTLKRAVHVVGRCEPGSR